ncbi:metallophosphoesterase [Sphingomonas jatrophae]|uniref:Serine/threonine protein phosphatase 1 n=1 Tax=Sphingomonas jatrophae TaxID=1166337 RepID=A0A1I6L6I9_9SPHN|nr:metallophosphoesterase [Sphingomonas jatrophae]SFR98848.1 serine/threonine protein phosphatase 1 [Sphingomonas jatrophae]
MRLPFFSSAKRAAAERPAPAVPPGTRIYAIGDVHGCAEELRRLLDMIAADHEARGPATLTIILLGDLMNRGPDAAGAIEQARALVASGTGRLLKGNHEELFVKAARGDRASVRALMVNGGAATLASFGLEQAEVERGDYGDLAALLKARIPRDIVSFLDAGEDKIALGDYLFVHAGIRPGVPIAEQAGSDLRWIRREFLHSREGHGAVIVHGHTITDGVDEQDNRIGIDTGAYRSGILTAIGLEGTARWYLATAG